MSIEIKVPTLPESVADATILEWHKQAGDHLVQGELLVELETDKVVLEVPAPEDGVLDEIALEVGVTVTAEQILGRMTAGAVAAAAPPAKTESEPADEKPTSEEESEAPEDAAPGKTSPSVRKLLSETNQSAQDITGTGRHGRILKSDVIAHDAEQAAEQAKPTPVPATSAPAPAAATQPINRGDLSSDDENRPQRRVPMTRLRVRIAERLLEAKRSTAMLTTFNEVNMQALMDLRNNYKNLFEKTHDTKLGFMSMFVKAATIALQRFPEVNASLDGNDVIYHGFCDIGIAVSSERGLVVPILRSTEHMSLAQVESGIVSYANKARQGKLAIDELKGGTFTITNGGVFGSLLSTPILNPPQSAILGMHAIQKRPVAENDQVVIRPMMYIALSYDHRIIDGQGAVSFLKTIKELVEDPARVLLEV